MKYRPCTYRKQHATRILRKVYNETHPEKPLFPDELSRDEKTWQRPGRSGCSSSLLGWRAPACAAGLSAVDTEQSSQNSSHRLTGTLIERLGYDFISCSFVLTAKYEGKPTCLSTENELKTTHNGGGGAVQKHFPPTFWVLHAGLTTTFTWDRATGDNVHNLLGCTCGVGRAPREHESRRRTGRSRFMCHFEQRRRGRGLGFQRKSRQLTGRRERASTRGTNPRWATQRPWDMEGSLIQASLDFSLSAAFGLYYEAEETLLPSKQVFLPEFLQAGKGEGSKVLSESLVSE